MEPAGILSGLQVIEYADFVSGPYVGRQLAEFGADVIKVEPPSNGDSGRRTGPFAHDAPALENSLLFNRDNLVSIPVLAMDALWAAGPRLVEYTPRPGTFASGNMYTIRVTP